MDKLSFPINCLLSLSEPIMQLQRETQAPIEICFASAFSVLNHAAQAIANVMTPYGAIIPISCFFISVAESGERKTACEKITGQITKLYQDKLAKQYQKDLRVYKNALDIYEAERKSIVKKKIEYKEKQELIDLLEPPTMPRHPLLITTNPTMQGLKKVFENGMPSILLSSSEGGQFLGGYAMSQDNQLNTLATLSLLWDGSAIDQVKQEGTILIMDNRRLALHLGVQPDIFAEFIKNKCVTGQGFLARCLIATPQSLAGTRHYSSLINDGSVFLKQVFKPISQLYNLNQLNNEGLILQTMAIDAEADELLKEFFYYGEDRIKTGGEFVLIRGFVNKSIEHVLRVAATLALYHHPHTTIITKEHVNTAIAIITFYMHEQLHWMSKNQPISKQTKDLDYLHNFIKRKYADRGYFTLRELTQYISNRIRNKAILLPLINTLVAQGVLKYDNNRYIFNQQSQHQ